ADPGRHRVRVRRRLARGRGQEVLRLRAAGAGLSARASLVHRLLAGPPLALSLGFGACSGPAPPPSPSTPPATTVAAPGASPAPLPLGPRLYVTNERSGDLSVIDLGSRQVLATVRLRKRPRGIRASAD